MLSQGVCPQVELVLQERRLDGSIFAGRRGRVKSQMYPYGSLPPDSARDLLKSGVTSQNPVFDGKFLG